MKDRKVLLYVIVIIALIVFYTYRQDVKTIEEYDISSGFGNDIEKIFEDEIENSVTYSIYDFKNENESKSYVKEGRATSIGETRPNRSLKSGRAPLIGLQKVIILSEESAKEGIKSTIDILFFNPKMNDRSLFVVCKGKAIDILNFKVKGYASSSDFIEGIVKTLNKSDFFLDEYSILNAFVVLDGEGRNLVFPYLELINNELRISGMAVFKEDKMIYKLDLKESRIMNMLRENRSKGLATVSIDKDKYISYSAKVKRHVSCKKGEDKYFFHLKIDCLANIISSKGSKEINYDRKKELGQLIKKDSEEQFLAFINKMQNEYKLDMLQLGFIAASKYGKDTGINWNEEISKAKITIDVNVKVQESKRGEY